MATKESDLQIRIVAGTLRGRRISVPNTAGLRPTTERVREAIFSVLGSIGGVEGSVVLDLYAGTGALGFEALSRGASHAIFVEHQRQLSDALKRSISELSLQGTTAVIESDLQRVVSKEEVNSLFARALSATPREKVDLIFADPPYEIGFRPELLSAVLDSGLLKDGGVVVWEGDAEAKFSTEVAGSAGQDRLELFKLKQYGDTQVAFFTLRSTGVRGM